MSVTVNDLVDYHYEKQPSDFKVGESVETYKRYPKDKTSTTENIQSGIEWERGVYLGNDISSVEIAKIQSTESSNKIEGIVTTSTRMKQFFEEKTTPRNRDEDDLRMYVSPFDESMEKFIVHNEIGE